MLLDVTNFMWLSSFLIKNIFEIHPGNGVTGVQIQAFLMYFLVLRNYDNKQSRVTDNIALFNDVIVTTI